ncbi:hypothetical protein L3Q82_021181 [Scortum barcoo]|uniref:Uncharacterized protein n=1 Tax=Scortum barcoo TaxID=214431 RepID=A0ACB8X3B7_9TELE|nr:hypothetical protein L3Q82_021181 [Scortum barcoo]
MGVASLVKWCNSNNLSLNTDKTKEMVLDMRRERGGSTKPLMITDSEVELCQQLQVPGRPHLCDDLTWTLTHHPAGQEGSSAAVLPEETEDPAVIESILSSCITVWYENSTESGEDSREDRPGAAAHSAGHQPPQSPQESLQHHQRPSSPPHPQHTLLSLLPSSRSFI